MSNENYTLCKVTTVVAQNVYAIPITPTGMNKVLTIFTSRFK